MKYCMITTSIIKVTTIIGLIHQSVNGPLKPPFSFLEFVFREKRKPNVTKELPGITLYYFAYK